MNIILGLDIGGTHISGGLIEQASGKLLGDSFTTVTVHSRADSSSILKEWKNGIMKHP